MLANWLIYDHSGIMVWCGFFEEKKVFIEKDLAKDFQIQLKLFLRLISKTQLDANVCVHNHVKYNSPSLSIGTSFV